MLLLLLRHRLKHCAKCAVLCAQLEATVCCTSYCQCKYQINHDQSLIAAAISSTVVSNFSASAIVFTSTMSNLQPAS